MYSARYSCQILIKLEFSRQIYEKTRISNFMKIRPAGAEVFHTDGVQIDTKLTVTFRNCANAPKNHSPHAQLRYNAAFQTQNSAQPFASAASPNGPLPHLTTSPPYNLQFPTLYLISRPSFP
jgi:hypothetical protein